MGQRLQTGDRVRIDSGNDAGKLGDIIPRRIISYTASRKGSIPQVEGATGPLRMHDFLVQLDSGRIVVVPKERLSKIVDGDFSLLDRAA